MDIRFTGTFKSIAPFDWAEIPEFVVLTGVNGSGKTQLLELINDSIATANEGLPTESFLLTGFPVPGHAMLIRADWNRLHDLDGIGLRQLQSDGDRLWQEFEVWRNRPGVPPGQPPPHHRLFSKIVQDLQKPVDRIDRVELIRSLPTYLPNQPDQIFNAAFGKLCVRYWMRARDLRLKGTSASDVVEQIGPEPWSVLNDILQVSQMPFRVTDPTEMDSTDTYTCKLVESSTNASIRFTELSSGEQVIISLAFWLFNLQDPAAFPKLLLLDEPDAHLHPSMAKQFIDVVVETVVRKYGVRVIMTTHSPTTVALTPDGALFEMQRSGERVRPVSRDRAIHGLTSGLVVVRPGIRFVLVEDDDDVAFYAMVQTELARAGNISTDVPLAFVSAGRRAEQDDSGGRGQVTKWVTALGDAGLTDLRGIVDADGRAVDVNGVVQLGRYSIENYLVDPFVVYAALVNAGKAPRIDGVDLGRGGEREICKLPLAVLMAIRNSIEAPVVTSLNLSSSSTEREVIYTNGQKVPLPEWIFTQRGKDLLRIYRNAYQSIINMRSLREAFERLQFIPVELQDRLRALQTT